MLNSSKLFKDQIFHEPVGWVQFVVFEYFSSALLQEIAREIMFLLSNNIYEKVSLKGKVNEILKAHALFVICINVPALHPCYMTNALGFSQSDARKFFIYIF